jgi:hypothetical protein
MMASTVNAGCLDRFSMVLTVGRTASAGKVVRGMGLPVGLLLGVWTTT